jgi:hypothetical protein
MWGTTRQPRIHNPEGRLRGKSGLLTNEGPFDPIGEEGKIVKNLSMESVTENNSLFNKRAFQVVLANE